MIIIIIIIIIMIIIIIIIIIVIIIIIIIIWSSCYDCRMVKLSVARDYLQGGSLCVELCGILLPKLFMKKN